MSRGRGDARGGCGSQAPSPAGQAALRRGVGVVPTTSTREHERQQQAAAAGPAPRTQTQVLQLGGLGVGAAGRCHQGPLGGVVVPWNRPVLQQVLLVSRLRQHAQGSAIGLPKQPQVAIQQLVQPVARAERPARDMRIGACDHMPADRRVLQPIPHPPRPNSLDHPTRLRMPHLASITPAASAAEAPRTTAPLTMVQFDIRKPDARSFQVPHWRRIPSSRAHAGPALHHGIATVGRCGAITWTTGTPVASPLPKKTARTARGTPGLAKINVQLHYMFDYGAA